MSKTKIEWTDRRWNPVRGCSRVSEGCRHCYAERQAARFSDFSEPFAGFAQRTNAGPRWTGAVELIEHKLTEPLGWRRWAAQFRREHGRRPRCFVNSMSDLFHEALPDEAIDEVFAVMAICPDIDFQVLTKRPKRMREWARRREWSATIPETCIEIECSTDDGGGVVFNSHSSEAIPWPLPNVQLVVSVEDQPTADERIPELLQTPAAVRGVSYEPALGPVNLHSSLGGTRWIGGQRGCGQEHHHDERCRPGLDWIIAGGESGPGARPAHPDWFRAVRDQCAAAGVPFFFKQWGEWEPVGALNHSEPPQGFTTDRRIGLFNYAGNRRGLAFGSLTNDLAPFSDGSPCEWVRRVGKKAAGRLLDGRAHSEFPEARHGG